MYWQLIGFGLTVSWLWLFFLSGPVFVSALKQWPGNPDIYFLFFMLCTSLTYLAIGKWLSGFSLVARKGLLTISTVCISAGSGLICLLPGYKTIFPAVSGWIIYLLIALGGFGITLLLLGWMETFLNVSVKRFAFSYAGGIAIASIFLFGNAILDLQTGIILVTIIPWLVLLLILRQKTGRLTEKLGDDNIELPVLKAFPPKLIGLIILFYTAGGLMFKLIGTKYTLANFFWISNLSYMAVVILAGCAVYFNEELDLRLLYRPVLPLLSTGFILFPFLPGNYTIVSFLFLQAGFALFDMYTWLVIVYIARNHFRTLPVLGLGMFWITFSMFGGNLAFTVLAALIPFNRPLDALTIIAGLLTLLAALIFPGNKETFAGWEFGGAGLNYSEKLEAGKEGQSENSGFLESHNLTPRETEILALILKGRNNPFIREKLNISPNTLKFHLRNIYQKFAVNNRQELLGLFEKENFAER